MKKNYILCLVLICFKGLSLFSQEYTGIYPKEQEGFLEQRDQYNQTLAEAMYMQLKADSLARLAREKRILAREIPETVVKKELMDESLILEKEAEHSQYEADMLFDKARTLKMEWYDSNETEDTVVSLYKTVNDIKVYQYNTKKSSETLPISGNMKKLTDTAEKKSDEPDQTRQKTKDDTDAFEILDKSPYNKDNPIPEGLSDIPGLIYRIQLGAFSNPVPYDAFAGISPIYYEKAGRDTVLKYYAGLFFSLVNVTDALDKVRSIGFPDAFIVAFMDGIQISTEKAREIEFTQYKL